MDERDAGTYLKSSGANHVAPGMEERAAEAYPKSSGVDHVAPGMEERKESQPVSVLIFAMVYTSTQH
ncbi:unnamed protein product [Albugo candida]|uniref:Uncharacterized protein n=1 Tax=Albugo candida TaxID=65357 RepID=A0A024FY11_9STRA|nr:unnamed protein product [Albugo candida]|eukprot:CCI11817.1 unnamed protein product [Albugo candida]